MSEILDRIHKYKALYKKIFAFLGRYAAWVGGWLPTLRDSLSVSSSSSRSQVVPDEVARHGMGAKISNTPRRTPD